MEWRGIARTLRAGALREPAPPVPSETVAALAEQLEASSRRRLGRSLAIFAVNAGSCGGCELELRALDGVLYDLARFGLRFAHSPRAADILLLTGPLTRNLREAVEQSWQVMADPKWVVAVGDCAIDGGVFKAAYGCLGGIGRAIPIDLVIPGCPPPPAQILSGLRAVLAVNAR